MPTEIVRRKYVKEEGERRGTRVDEVILTIPDNSAFGPALIGALNKWVVAEPIPRRYGHRLCLAINKENAQARKGKVVSVSPNRKREQFLDFGGVVAKWVENLK